MTLKMLAVNKSLSVLDLSDCGVTDVEQYIASGLAENNSLQPLSIIIIADSAHFMMSYMKKQPT